MTLSVINRVRSGKPNRSDAESFLRTNEKKLPGFRIGPERAFNAAVVHLDDDDKDDFLDFLDACGFEYEYDED